MKQIILLLLGTSFSIFASRAYAKTLHVGTGQTYSSPVAAASAALPGDTILLHAGTYSGPYFISNLLGNKNAWIVFRGESKDLVTFQGGSEALHFSHIEFVKIQDISFTGQTGNGMNIDDNGNSSTPSKNFVVHNCRFRYMGAQGNNDFLKLSGLDSFEVTNCTFLKGATGGSGIDMVGCHYGNFRYNTFDSLGSNCIQAKGGTQYILIENNTFRDGGQRSVNLGGSTGLQFFRPIDAKFEAADIQVYANVFIRGVVPIAYVGSENVDVANNTIYMPEKWVIRILQETVDTSRFVPCRNGIFRNNIIFFSSAVTTHVNIGPNTAPQSFLFSHNLWYNSSVPTQSTPSLPVTETSAIIGQNPIFFSTSDFAIQWGSPAISSGFQNYSLGTDISGLHYKDPPSRGAYEYYHRVSIQKQQFPHSLNIYPNPSTGIFHVENKNIESIKIFDVLGNLILQKQLSDQDTFCLPVQGIYFVQCYFQGQTITRKVVVN